MRGSDAHRQMRGWPRIRGPMERWISMGLCSKLLPATDFRERPFVARINWSKVAKRFRGRGMQIIGFLVFLLVSHLILMPIFLLATYHAYFLRALPLLICYSMLVGWLLYALDFHAFFLWQVVLVSGWLFVISKKQQKELRRCSRSLATTLSTFASRPPRYPRHASITHTARSYTSLDSPLHTYG